MGIKNYFT